MKKNRMLRLASVLVICVLLTTSVIGGTFAKYTSQATADDSARIAKWGINAPTDLEFDLFATDAFAAGKVASSNTDKVLAPGTSHEQAVKLFTITGTAPEVKYDYTVDLKVEPTNSATIAQLDSLPGFNWTLKAPGAATATKYGTFSALQTAVNALSQEGIAPNNLPNGYTGSDDTMTIGWAWDFDTEAKDGTNDAADTAAGKAAADGTLPTFKLTLAIGATQAD